MLSEGLTLQRAVAGSNLARFGDGELKIARGKDAKSQPHHPALEKALRAILRDWRSTTVLPCIPNINAGDKSPKEGFWAQYRNADWVKLYAADGYYGSSFVTRPDSMPRAPDKNYWALLEMLWVGLDVVVVTGSHKGLQAADLKHAASVETIAAPAQNAWTVHDQLLDRLKGAKGRNVLLCLGATATVLAWELAAHGVHAIDLGHVGMFLRKHRAGQALEVTDADRAQI